MGKYVQTLLIYLNFMRDMWDFSDYLNNMLFKHDEKNNIKYSFFDVKFI